MDQRYTPGCPPDCQSWDPVEKKTTRQDLSIFRQFKVEIPLMKIIKETSSIHSFIHSKVSMFRNQNTNPNIIRDQACLVDVVELGFFFVVYSVTVPNFQEKKTITHTSISQWMH